MIPDVYLDRKEREMEEPVPDFRPQDYEWNAGFNLCAAGLGEECCRTRWERKGWRAARHSEGTLDCPAYVLEAVGV